MKHRILFISRFSEESISIRDLLMRSQRFEVDWVRTSAQAVDSLTHRIAHVGIINTEVLNAQRISLVDQMRRMGFNFPILILAHASHPQYEQQLKPLGSVMVLEKPTTEVEILGVIDKFLQGEKVHIRTYRRYNTKQQTRIELWNTGEAIAGEISNLSLGGAQLDLQDSNIQIGDILKLKIDLDALKKKHELNAKVVWSAGYDPISKTNSVGVKFVNNSEVYQTLLQKI